jgi:hypothetical protein
MMAPGFHPARVAFASVPGAEGVYPGSIGCRIAWIADEPDRVALEVDAAAPAFVVLADGWFPGWRARIDGRETPLHRVNQLVRGVAVPGGRHRVEMRFEPQGWRTGVRFTNLGLVATLVLALAWAAWTWRVARRPAPAA